MARASSTASTRSGLLLPVAVTSVLALLFRILYLASGSGNPFWTHLGLDLARYDEWARNILGGRGAVELPFTQAPLYPWMLSLAYAVLGPDPVRALWFQLVPGVLAVALVAWAAGCWRGPAAAWAAGILLALYKPAIYYTGVLLPPAWTLACSSLFLCLVLCRGALSVPWWDILIGLSLGAAVLAQPTLLILAVPAAVWIWRRSPAAGNTGGKAADKVAGRASGGGPKASPRMLRQWVFLGLGLALPLMITLLANGIGGGAWSFIAVNGGVNSYIGNGPEANGGYVRPPGMREDRDLLGVNAALSALGRTDLAAPGAGAHRHGEGLALANSYWASRARSFALSHPLRTAGLYLRKLLFFFGQYEIPQVESLPFERQYSALLRLPLPGMALLAALALAAAILLGRSEGTARWLLASAVSVAAAVAVFFVTARFRLAVAPFLAILAGGGWSELRHRLVAAKAGESGGGQATAEGAAPSLARASRKDIVVALSGGALLLVLLSLNLTGIRKEANDGQYHFRLGVIAEQEKRPAEAAREYAQALSLDPTLGKAEVNLGTLLARQGNRTDARAHLTRGLALDPQSAVGHLNLGQLEQMEGRPEEALAEYRKALEIDPALNSARESAALLLYGSGRVDEAQALLEAVQQAAQPGSPAALRSRNLLGILSSRADLGSAGWKSCRLLLEGDLRMAQGDRAGAEALYRKAAADPQGAEAASRMLR